MASYLLKSDDADMERWKASARDRGYTFAEFIRAALDDHSKPPPTARRARPEPVEETRVVPPPPTVPPPVRPPDTQPGPTGGKRSYESDFKKEKKR